jgi:hypothetical protein
VLKDNTLIVETSKEPEIIKPNEIEKKS